jgi:hypothetical protein
MVLLNTGLYLPSLDIEALHQGKSIVAITKRFMVPGKRFVLYPSHSSLLQGNLKDVYREEFLSHLQGDLSLHTQEVIAWAKCEFCQSYSEKEKILSIAAKTIWSSQYLEAQLNIKNSLFLTFLQVYKLPKPIFISSSLDGSGEESLRGFIPLPDYLDVDEDNPVFVKQEFDERKEKFLNPSVSEIEVVDENSQPQLTLTDENDPKKEESIVDSPNWFEQIARIGNSSDGHTFEKLVRKSFLSLGFSNSRNDPKISLDPHATGGAGGLDFYCETPYPVVGECKATKSTKVPDGTPAQLIKLGNGLLGPEQYKKSIKVVVAAGDLTKAADTTAKGNSICVIRPEALQRLIELHQAYPGSFTLQQLRERLEKPPFSQVSNEYVLQLVNESWEQLQLRSLLVEIVRIMQDQKPEDKPFSVDGIYYFYNGRFASKAIEPLPSKVYARDLLIELSSPLAGYLGRVKDATSGEEGFYFIRELKIEN